MGEYRRENLEERMVWMSHHAVEKPMEEHAFIVKLDVNAPLSRAYGKVGATSAPGKAYFRSKEGVGQPWDVSHWERNDGEGGKSRLGLDPMKAAWKWRRRRLSTRR